MAKKYIEIPDPLEMIDEAVKDIPFHAVTIITEPGPDVPDPDDDPDDPELDAPPTLRKKPRPIS